MEELNQEIISFIEETKNKDQDVEAVIETHNQLVQNLENFQPLCAIAATKNPAIQQHIKHGAIIYINEMMSNAIKNWDGLDEAARGMLFSSLLELFRSGLEQSSFHTLLGSLILLLAREDTPWDEVIQLPIAFVSNEQQFLEGVWLFHTMVSLMPPELFAQQEDSLVDIATRALASSNIDLRVHGATLIFEVVAKHKALTDGEIKELPDQYNLIAEIAQNPSGVSSSLCIVFWQNVVTPLSSFKVFTQEQIQAIAAAAFEFAANESQSVEIKTTILAALVPSIDLLGDAISSLFSLDIQILAKEIENDQSIPDDLLTSISNALQIYSHFQIFPPLQEVIQEKLQSSNEYEQMAGLLVYRVFLQCAKDLAVMNLDSLMTFLAEAITSENELMVQTVLKIINSFENQTGVFQPYTMTLLPNVLQLCAAEDFMIREDAYLAALTILDDADTTIEDIFNNVWALSETLDDSDSTWIGFLRLLPYAISLSDEIDDDQIDQLLQLVERVLSEQSEQPFRVVLMLQVGIALMKKDDTQAETLVEMLGELATNCLNSDNADFIFEAESYFMNITIILGESISEILTPSIEKLVEYATSEESMELVQAGAIEALVVITKKCSDKREELLPIMIQTIDNSLENDLDILLEASLKGVRKLNSFFDAETQRNFFTKTVNIIQNEDNPENGGEIDDAFYVLQKLVQKPKEENKEFFIEQSVPLIQGVIESTLPFLNEQPLIHSPAFAEIAPPFLNFVCEVIQYPVDFVDAIVTYLLTLINEEGDNARVIFDGITGVFTDAVKSPHLSEEVRGHIFEVIPVLIENSNDPVTQQNLVFFLISLIRANPANCEQVIPFLATIDQWYNSGKENKFGYAETLANIASFYLEIAAIHPDTPDELIQKALAEFPPADEQEALPMTQKLISLGGRISANPQLYGEMALAIARFFVMDDTSMAKCNIDNTLKGQLAQILKTAATSNPEIMSALSSAYSNQRAKFKKLNQIFSQ